MGTQPDTTAERAKAKGRPMTATFVARVSEPGVYGDGRGGLGLALRVRGTRGGRVSKNWTQRLRIGGRYTNVGVGSYPATTLAVARTRAVANAQAVAEGIDPRIRPEPPKLAHKLAEVLEAVIESKSSEWTNPRMAGQWRDSVHLHAPELMTRRVDDIDFDDVVGVLRPVWRAKPELARKLHQRLRACFEWARAAGHRADNPVDAKRIETVLGQRPKGGNYDSLHHGKVADALETINLTGAWPATKLCFAFLVATACRSGEAREATWGEVDWAAQIWTVPADRTKTRAEHRVPLSTMAMRVLDDAADAYGTDGLIFPAPMGNALTNAAMPKLCKENNIGAQPHGFRASFRSWAADEGVPRDVAEICLGHAVHGVEGRYQRSDMLDRRRVVMQRWADYLVPPIPTKRTTAATSADEALDLMADRYDDGLN